MPEIYKLIINNGTLQLQTTGGGNINLTGIQDLNGGTGLINNGFVDWKILHFTDTSANLLLNDPVLSVGQIVIESDSLLTSPKFKIGNGSASYSLLPYASSSIVGNFIPLSGTVNGSPVTGTLELDPSVGTVIQSQQGTRISSLFNNGQRVSLVSLDTSLGISTNVDAIPTRFQMIVSQGSTSYFIRSDIANGAILIQGILRGTTLNNSPVSNDYLQKAYADSIYLPKTKVSGSSIVSGGSITLPNVPTFIYTISPGSILLWENDDYTRSGATLTFINPSVSDGDKIYYKYEF